jgi:hypothetical protein
MNSQTLKEKGFETFVPLDGLPFSSLPYNKGSVLVLVDRTLTGKPASDILYIGKSKKLTKKIFGGYLAGYGGKTTKKISDLLLNGRYIEKVDISWMLAADPKAIQQKLLSSFQNEHGGCPIWNTSRRTAVKAQPTPITVRPQSSRKIAARPKV